MCRGNRNACLSWQSSDYRPVHPAVSSGSAGQCLTVKTKEWRLSATSEIPHHSLRKINPAVGQFRVVDTARCGVTLFKINEPSKTTRHFCTTSRLSPRSSHQQQRQTEVLTYNTRPMRKNCAPTIDNQRPSGKRSSWKSLQCQLTVDRDPTAESVAGCHQPHDTQQYQRLHAVCTRCLAHTTLYMHPVSAKVADTNDISSAARRWQ